MRSRSGMPRQEFERLREQCEQMLQLSADSFVFLYSRSWIRVVPAVAIMGLRSSTNPQDLHSRKISQFFEDHIECFIGDRDIWRPGTGDLEQLLVDAKARQLLSLVAGGEITG